MFCKNCGNRLEDDDRVCAVCGEAVEPKVASEEPDQPEEPGEEPGEDETTSPDVEDIKTPLFDFKWNIQDFPKEEAVKTEDIDFTWEKPKDSPIVEKMRKAVDPEEIAGTPTFSEEEEAEKAVTDEWYEPFSMKTSPDDETLFKFNKRNEEFQELLDKEFEKYNTTKKAVIPEEVTSTKEYNIDDFKGELDKYKEEEKEEIKLPETIAPAREIIADKPKPINVISPEDLVVTPKEEQKDTTPEESEEIKFETPDSTVEELNQKEDASDKNTAAAGLGIFDTSFASPMQTTEQKKSNESIASLPDKDVPVKEIEPIENKMEPVIKEEPAKSEEPVGPKMVDTSVSKTENIPPKTEVIAPEIESIESIIKKEETPSETEPVNEPTSFNLIDTSFVSPFGAAEKDVEPEVAPEIEPKENTFDPGPKEIEEDEFLKDLPEGDGKTFTGAQQVATPGQPEIKKDEDQEKHKVVGPEIVNEPVVFPFELEDEDEQDIPTKEDLPKTEQTKTAANETISKETPTEPLEVKPEEVSKPETTPEPSKPEPSEKDKEENKPVIPNTSVNNAIPTKPENKKDENEPGGNKLIKFLIIMIIIIVVLLAGILVMKIIPNSTIGTVLNNAVGTLFNGTTSEQSDEPKNVAPSDDYDALIESLASENKNIKDIVYSDSIKYDDKVSYSIIGANNSNPIENNFWKSVDKGDLLFDEQAVKTIIGFNSTWVDYLNDGDDEVFDYVVPGSEAENVLKKEKLPKGAKSVVYNKLSIGEVRQNGNRFYVWTQENITIKNNDGTERKSNIKQLYEMETGSDALLITTNITL